MHSYSTNNAFRWVRLIFGFGFRINFEINPKCQFQTDFLLLIIRSDVHVLPTPHKVRRHNLRTIQVDRKDLDFSDRDILGTGTFSTVYHGKLLGMDVAVKSFK